MKKVVFLVVGVATLLAVASQHTLAKKNELCKEEDNLTKQHPLKRDHHHHSKDANRNHSKHQKRNKERSEEDDDELNRFLKEQQPGKWALNGHKHYQGQDAIPGSWNKKEHRSHRHDGVTQEKVKYDRKHIQQNQQEWKLGKKHGAKDWSTDILTRKTKQEYLQEIHTEKPTERTDDLPEMKTSQQTTPLSMRTQEPKIQSLQIDQKQQMQNHATNQPRKETSSNDITTDLRKENTPSCTSHASCEVGSCCQADKGTCKKYEILEGQACWDTCVCEGGLLCYAEVKNAENKREKTSQGICKAPDPDDLTKGVYLKQ